MAELSDHSAARGERLLYGLSVDGIVGWDIPVDGESQELVALGRDRDERYPDESGSPLMRDAVVSHPPFSRTCIGIPATRGGAIPHYKPLHLGIVQLYSPSPQPLERRCQDDLHDQHRHEKH